MLYNVAVPALSCQCRLLGGFLPANPGQIRALAGTPPGPPRAPPRGPGYSVWCKKGSEKGGGRRKILLSGGAGRGSRKLGPGGSLGQESSQ